MPEKEEHVRKKLVVEEIAETPSIPEDKFVSSEEIKNETEAPVQEKPIEAETPVKEEKGEEEPKPVAKETGVEASAPKGPNPLIIIIPGTFLLGALLGGIVYYQGKVSEEGVAASPTPTQTIQPAEETPAPSAKADLSKYSIAIQNGSGIAGEAGKVQKLLEDADFKVSGTGNADSYDYEQTIIKAKSTVDEAYLAELEKALSETYEVGKKVTLSSNSKDDVIVVVGSSKD